jgi:hypothetical protein
MIASYATLRFKALWEEFFRNAKIALIFKYPDASKELLLLPIDVIRSLEQTLWDEIGNDSEFYNKLRRL